MHAPLISPELLRELETIEPSRSDLGIEYRPCRVQRDTGEWIDFVYLVEADSFMEIWGIAPEDDEGKVAVDLNHVMHVEESPARLPAPLANRMYAAGESGMGYHVFLLVLRDGRALDCLTGGAVDFVQLSDGVTIDDVVDLVPHAGEARANLSPCENLPYAWCLYRLPPAG